MIVRPMPTCIELSRQAKMPFLIWAIIDIGINGMQLTGIARHFARPCREQAVKFYAFDIIFRFCQSITEPPREFFALIIFDK